MNDADLAQKFQGIVDSYRHLLNEDITRYANQVTALPLVSPKPSTLIYLANRMKEIFASEPVVLELSGPLVIVGDLHGHLLDLIRILHEHGLQKRYLFLGDIVDRGEFSIETVTLIYALKVLHPDQFFIIRGNHEFESLCSTSGFSDEVLKSYSNPYIFKAFVSSFSQMPLCAIINHNILCLHGGIGPSWFSIEQARNIQRPIADFGDDFLDSILWSDPIETVEHFEVSSRGSGYLFGELALTEFLDSNGFTCIIRAHECIPEGCQYKFNQRLITVFSASNYCGAVNNLSATLEINESSTITTYRRDPLAYVKREWAQFGTVDLSSTGDPAVVAKKKRLTASMSGFGYGTTTPVKGGLRGVSSSSALPPLSSQKFSKSDPNPLHGRRSPQRKPAEGIHKSLSLIRPG